MIKIFTVLKVQLIYNLLIDLYLENTRLEAPLFIFRQTLPHLTFSRPMYWRTLAPTAITASDPIEIYSPGLFNKSWSLNSWRILEQTLLIYNQGPLWQIFLITWPEVHSRIYNQCRVKYFLFERISRLQRYPGKKESATSC